MERSKTGGERAAVSGLLVCTNPDGPRTPIAGSKGSRNRQVHRKPERSSINSRCGNREASRPSYRTGFLAFLVRSLRVGIAFVFLRGMLAGIEGTFVRSGSDNNLVISVETIQQSIAIHVDASDVEPAFMPVTGAICRCDAGAFCRTRVVSNKNEVQTMIRASVFSAGVVALVLGGSPAVLQAQGVQNPPAANLVAANTLASNPHRNIPLQSRNSSSAIPGTSFNDKMC